MKKLILALAVLLTAALVFTGCGGNEAGGNPASSELDGEWICSITVEESLYVSDLDDDEIEEILDDLSEEVKKASLPIEKLVLKGNTCEEFVNNANQSKWIHSGCQGNAPTKWVSLGKGTYKLEGNTFTTVNDKGEELVSAIMSADKKSLSLIVNGMTVIFKKQ